MPWLHAAFSLLVVVYCRTLLIKQRRERVFEAL
jgi:hypothetical protein